MHQPRPTIQVNIQDVLAQNAKRSTSTANQISQTDSTCATLAERISLGSTDEETALEKVAAAWYADCLRIPGDGPGLFARVVTAAFQALDAGASFREAQIVGQSLLGQAVQEAGASKEGLLTLDYGPFGD